MRTLWKDILISLLMGMVMPWMVLNFAVTLMEAPSQQDSLQTQPGSGPAPTAEACSMYLRMADGSIERMDLDAYLLRVVLAEMPASFEMEALKAQAVVARTYTARAYTTGGKHGDGSVCTDSGCCQAYITEKEYLEKGGSMESVAKIRGAVEETSCQVLTYEGELIEATYFSCSGGITEDAAAVWGTEYPYLQSVESPGEEGASVYTDTTGWSVRELCTLLGLEDTRPVLGTVTYTDGGGVDTMELCGKRFRGTELRQLLGLRSTAFTVAVEGDTVTITTRGYGHRVGMSQYGADAMALNGSSCEEILAHYYQGTEICRLEIDESGELRYDK